MKILILLLSFFCLIFANRHAVPYEIPFFYQIYASIETSSIINTNLDEDKFSKKNFINFLEHVLDGSDNDAKINFIGNLESALPNTVSSDSIREAILNIETDDRVHLVKTKFYNLGDRSSFGLAFNYGGFDLNWNSLFGKNNPDLDNNSIYLLNKISEKRFEDIKNIYNIMRPRYKNFFDQYLEFDNSNRKIKFKSGVDNSQYPTVQRVLNQIKRMRGSNFGHKIIDYSHYKIIGVLDDNKNLINGHDSVCNM